MISRILLSVLLAGGTTAAALNAQVITTLTLTPGSNAITASSLLNGLTAGSVTTTGSDVTQWTGTITVQLDDAFNPTSFTILSASLVAQNGGVYIPDVYGGLGNAPGNYSFYYPGSSAAITLAVREAHASLGGGPLALSGSGGNYTFSPAGIAASFTGRIDHRAAVNGGWANFLPNGTFADVATANGSLVQSGSNLALRLPLDTSFSVNLTDSNGFARGNVSFHLVGTLNATGVIPEPSTWALAAAGLAGMIAARIQRR